MVQTKRIVQKIDGLVRGFSIPAFKTKLWLLILQNCDVYPARSLCTGDTVVGDVGFQPDAAGSIPDMFKGQNSYFLDDTKNSKFETTIKFCRKQNHHVVVFTRIKHCTSLL